MNIRGSTFFGGLGTAFAVLLALALVDAGLSGIDAQRASVIDATPVVVGERVGTPPAPEVVPAATSSIRADETDTAEEPVPAPRIVEVLTDTAPVLPTVTPADIGLSLGERTALVDLHNQARAEKGIAPLTWSQDIAESVSVWVQELKQRGCVLEHSGNEQFGENLYYGMKSNGQTTVREVMSAFTDEEKYYDPVTNSCEAGEKCGHYTQIMWEDTTKIGCAKAVCIEPGRREEVWGCQYGPAGNVMGQRPYTLE